MAIFTPLTATNEMVQHRALRPKVDKVDTVPADRERSGSALREPVEPLSPRGAKRRVWGESPREAPR